MDDEKRLSVPLDEDLASKSLRVEELPDGGKRYIHADFKKPENNFSLVRNYFAKINKIEDLLAVRKALSDESYKHIEKAFSGEQALEKQLLNYVYNGGYNQAIDDVLQILREKGDSYTWEEVERMRSEKAKNVNEEK